MTTEYPESFARFYDIMYQQLRDSVDHEFFLEHINQTGGKILEVGVGTGRFFLDALNGGADIYGLDISESMIDVLMDKINAEESHRISIQNITDFIYDFQFDLIIAPFRVMMHLKEKENQIAALNNVYDHLNSGGRFIFDAFVPDLKQLISGIKNHTDFEAEYEPGKKLKRTVTTVPELISQLINVSFDLEWEEDGGLKQETWSTQLRYFFRYELEHLIERSRFDDYQIMGDYQGNKLDEESKEFIIECLKF
ncbi:class I SAM-dependent methyltransferase [Bacteroidota bacterium]